MPAFNTACSTCFTASRSICDHQVVDPFDAADVVDVVDGVLGLNQETAHGLGPAIGEIVM
jgi:hypothetical protein